MNYRFCQRLFYFLKFRILSTDCQSAVMILVIGSERNRPNWAYKEQVRRQTWFLIVQFSGIIWLKSQKKIARKKLVKICATTLALTVSAMSSCVGQHLTLQVHTQLKIREDFQKQARTSNYLQPLLGTVFLISYFILHFNRLYSYNFIFIVKNQFYHFIWRT